MTKRSSTEHIVIHCSDTPPSMDVGVAEVREWHLQRGWDDVGYHYIIKRDGAVQCGRPLYDMGAHVKGRNQSSLGICLIGGLNGNFDFTRHQLDSLKSLVLRVKGIWPAAGVVGHRQFDPSKECPGFNVPEWWNEKDWRENDYVAPTDGAA